MLHITNGESAAQGLRDADLNGEILCWNDVLHEGPVPSSFDTPRFEETRARFIAGCVGASFDAVKEDFLRRSARLAAARVEEEVVLWFEHDLYDQLQLIEILTRLAPRHRRPRRVVQVASNRYLGTMPGEWFQSEFAYREPVSDAAWTEAARAWAALVAPDPWDLDRLRSSFLELPFLGTALTRHLQEYPSTRNGLSRLEAQLLNAISDGPQDLLAVYHASHHDCEEAIFLSDSIFAWHVSRLSQGEGALVKRLDGLPIDLPRRSTPDYWEQRILLTPLGERIFAGQLDRVAAAGIDRWLGGVHLLGRSVRWRWDEEHRRLVSDGE
jgi:hypothetical protein